MRRRRTARWRSATRWRGQSPARARAAVVAVLLLCTTAFLADGPALAAGTPEPYAFAPDAEPVTGATSTADAAPLAPGTTYKSSLPGEGEIHYRLDLDDTSDAYVSVIAVPPPGSTIKAGDGIRVSVRDADERTCSQDTSTFRGVHSPRPLGAWGAREISANRTGCDSAGAYDVIVERLATTGSSLDSWGLELFAASEPPRKQTGATSAPEAWDSASPAPVTGEAEPRRGGSGFTSAAPLGEGVWSTDLEPGRTLFYEVPLDWGRQLSATAELGDSNAGNGYAVPALNLALYNPVRGFVDDASTTYNGSLKATELAPLPPVAYENRYAALDRLSAMRFAGSYYLVVHLSPEVAEKYGDGPFTLTLRVRVAGSAQAGPGYAGESEPAGVFDTTAGDREATAGGAIGGGDGGDAAMTVLAVSGIGAGTLVLVVLGVWMVVARRRVGTG
ncbi:hypothetical protein IM697_01060 [Streptomyces ferrugineus]|uniref:Peptidase n=1 Tax=Streptomyces ferrugineus TaxID=1413221 RepID=A0A7M2SX63_9ACTN|nr:hypothetical protein [Streptomyces ferrugineus]QOV40956.1 hypothetical protein IM697_01060 [Streptomyces ferrugineus]